MLLELVLGGYSLTFIGWINSQQILLLAKLSVITNTIIS